VFRARLLTWLFAVLLLGMQQTSQLHALSHLGGLFDRPHEQGLQVPVSDTPCLLCELSAGGSAATAADVQALPNVGPAIHCHVGDDSITRARRTRSLPEPRPAERSFEMPGLAVLTARICRKSKERGHDSQPRGVRRIRAGAARSIRRAAVTSGGRRRSRANPRRDPANEGKLRSADPSA
jgi:hypothetical protein